MFSPWHSKRRLPYKIQASSNSWIQTGMSPFCNVCHFGTNETPFERFSVLPFLSSLYLPLFPSYFSILLCTNCDIYWYSCRWLTVWTPYIVFLWSDSWISENPRSLWCPRVPFRLDWPSLIFQNLFFALGIFVRFFLQFFPRFVIFMTLFRPGFFLHCTCFFQVFLPKILPMLFQNQDCKNAIGIWWIWNHGESFVSSGPARW